MKRWYALLDGPHEDRDHVKRFFTASQYEFDEIDGKFALGAPALESCSNREEVIDASTELVASLNTTLRLSVDQYTGFELHGLAEKKPDGKMHRILFVRGVEISSASAVAIADSLSSRIILSREERLVLLLAENPEIEDIAGRLAIRPITWAAMTTVYESVAGMMSNKPDPGKRRSDYQGLIDRRWLTLDEAEGFYNTAAYHRKGYPKTPVRKVVPMEYRTACNLTKRLFWCLVDELKPA